jgi:hypothetical protein
MSFGDSSIAGGHVGNNTRNMSKVHKTRHNITRHEPKGEGPLTRQIRALSRGEKGPKHKANVLQIGPNFAGVAHAVLEAYRTKIGPK